jgi:hypothetical protein
MRQSQCDRHKVKMMDVFGPEPPFSSLGNAAVQPLRSRQWLLPYEIVFFGDGMSSLTKSLSVEGRGTMENKLPLQVKLLRILCRQ